MPSRAHDRLLARLHDVLRTHEGAAVIMAILRHAGLDAGGRLDDYDQGRRAVAAQIVGWIREIHPTAWIDLQRSQIDQDLADAHCDQSQRA